MKKVVKILIIIFILGYILSPVYTGQNQLFHSSNANKWKFNNVISSDQVVRVDIGVTAPNGHDVPPTSPLIIKLSEIASSFPTTVDAFGLTTPDISDDIKWDTAHVIHENSLIPSQVDDVDSITGFSEDDELVFALPRPGNLAGGEKASFSVYFGLNSADLPVPEFPEVCTLSVYPNITEINTIWSGMLGEEDGVYYIENRKLRAAVLKAAAWSTGGLYHIQLLDKEGKSRWDIVKQKFPYPSDIWKWSRFTVIEQFISQNQLANVYPGIVTKMITGPVRARISVRSTQPYTAGDLGGSITTINDLFGSFTFDIYADQTYLDYTLDITGANAASYSELPLKFQNREWGGDRPGTLYTGVYIPGTGWVERFPENTNILKVDASSFTDPWYLEALLEGTEVRPSSWHEPDKDPYRGYGFIFDNAGFSNITWDSGESLSSWYNAAQFPFKARYHPFDRSILGKQDKIAYMEEKYQEWSIPVLNFDFTATLGSIEEIPELTYQTGFTSQTFSTTSIPKSSQTTAVPPEISSESETSTKAPPSITPFGILPVFIMISIIVVVSRNKKK